MKKNKLAFFLPSMRGGGAERVMATLAMEFANRGYDVDMLLANAEGPYLDELSNNIRIFNLKTKRVAYAIWPLIKYIKEEKPIALLSTLNNANIVAVLAKILSLTKTRVVIRQASTLSLNQGESKNRRRISDWFMPLMVKIIYPLADCIVAVSKGVADDLSDFLKVDSTKISVIYNPVICSDLFINSQEVVDHPWFGDGKDPVIISVGRLNKYKDIETLIKAVSFVRKQKSVKLLILGEGEERNRLESLINKNNMQEIASMPGFVRNPFPYMKHARLLVLSSVTEGLPNVLIQSLALGTPVISTDCPSGPREILDNGKFGDLIPMQNPIAMATNILNVLNMHKEKNSVDIKNHLDQFSCTNVVNIYQNVLLNMN